jgi:5-(carboxyamino)imidazole ribonucleotide synthase
MGQKTKLGIIGGGQLGQMLTEAAIKLDMDVTVLDPKNNSPAMQAGANQIIKDFSAANIKELSDKVDYLTTEFEEGLDTKILEELSDEGREISPLAKTLNLIVDKVIQKDYLAEKGIPMGQYEAFTDRYEAADLLNEYDGKMVIKTRRGGYDGYGNRVVNSQEEIDKALKDFSGSPVYAEAFIPFKCELAVMAIRTKSGNVKLYPVVKTIQENNICLEVLAPSPETEDINEKAKSIALQVINSFEGAGAFGIEMFVTESGEVLLNEIAPRVHNSGHYTIEACESSQFEEHVRAVTGLPLSSSDMKVPFAVMLNILGKYNGEYYLEDLPLPENAHLHMYGKTPNKIGRKMGHITVAGDDIDTLRKQAQDIRNLIKI